MQASSPSSDGTLTLDLIQEDSGDAFGVCVEKAASRLSPGLVGSGKSQSLPGEAGALWEPPPGPLATAVKSRCASVDLILVPRAGRSPTATPINKLQELISQKLEATERLLTEARGEEEAGPTGAERLLEEALEAWNQAQEVLVEVKELRDLYQQLPTREAL